MNIAVIGLGLIGGSFCKAISAYTDNNCYGFDIDTNIISNALKDNAIIASCNPSDLSYIDVTIVCLYPQATVDFINTTTFKDGSIVIDTCGIKGYITENVKVDDTVTFIPTHPMAGREYSGYNYSCNDLFKDAYFILTPTNKDCKQVDIIVNLAKEIGFSNINITTPILHDNVIAFTSQLAHLTSNAFIKSKTLSKRKGFSAGSFKDLTRVAKLNPTMWTSLFMKNRKPLIAETKTLITHLTEYLIALENQDECLLEQLLIDGTKLKENDNANS